MTLKDFLENMSSDITFSVVFCDIPKAVMIFQEKPENFNNEIFDKQIELFEVYYEEYVGENIIGIKIK